MNDAQAPVNTLLEGQEIVDGILVETPEFAPSVALPLELIGSIIRNNLPGVELVRIAIHPTVWVRSVIKTTHDCAVILDMTGSSSYSGHHHFMTTEADLDDLLGCLKEAMGKATDNKCHCCGIASAWPTFETLAQRITHAVEALS